MPKSKRTDVSGDIGEHLAAEMLTPIATVEPRGETMELDFYCELRTQAGCSFHVQAKGSEAPSYGQDFITSLPISRKTVEEYWLKQVYPVYILMADVRACRVFYLRVTKDNYEPGSSETCTFRVPISHELTAESVGNLVPDILANQPKMTPEEAARMAAQFQEQNPLLCHDLTEIDAFLEIMRGTDQTTQMKAKVAIQTLVASSRLDSHRLESGLIEIFRNCKDRITQSHVLDTLVAIGATSAGPEIIKQVDRNTRTYEYMGLEQDARHPHIDFLFRGLARLRLPRLVDEVKRLLDHPDPVVVRGALSLAGELKLHGLNDRLLAFLKSPHPLVREDAARVIATLDQRATKTGLKKVLKNPTTPEQLAAVINALTQSQCFDAEEEVAGCLSHPSRDVRAAAADYLGSSANPAHFGLLVGALRDEEPEVRQKAGHGIALLSSVAAADKEAALLQTLGETFDAGKQPQAAAIMGELAKYAGEASRPLLAMIFRSADGKSIRQTYNDEYGNFRIGICVNLRAQALGILSRGSIEDLVDEVLAGLAPADEDALTIYLPVVEEKRIAPALEVIKGLAPELIADSARRVLATAYALNPEGAIAWATEQIMQTQDPRVFFGFCGTLHQRGIDLQTVPGVIGRVRQLFFNLDHRALPGFYDLVRRYQIPGASAIIAGDLRLILGPEAHERNMPIWDMYETLAALPDPEGHQSLLQHVRVCPSQNRLPILEYLAKYRPELARAELPHHHKDAELVVREGVERLIAELSAPET
jgi:HEAT repeat protein